MLQQKRIRKPPTSLLLEFPLLIKKGKNTKAKKKLKRCDYQIIPFPAKFISSNKIYCLYGDIIVLEHENSVILEPSLLSRFMKCETVTVSKVLEEPFIEIQLENKRGLKMPPWSQIVKKLKATRIPNLFKWAQIIKDYSEKYEQIVHSYDASQNFQSNEFDSARTELEAEKMKLLKSHPCVYLRSSPKEGRYGISKIIFTQSFVQELGYSLDIFASVLLQDGIPQLMPHDDDGATSEILKVLLQNYFLVKDQSYSTSELSSCIFTKDDNIKDVTLKAHFFPFTSQGTVVGVDIILTFLKIEDPYQQLDKVPKSRINRSYAQKALILQNEIKYFLTTYYPRFIPLQSINPDKVCKIRELYPFPDEEDNFYQKLEATKSEDL